MFRSFLFVVWLAAAAVALFLIAQPIGTSGQIIISLTVIAILLVISILKPDGVWRHVFLAAASIVVLRYAYWRATSTLPPVDDLYSFIPGIVLFMAEMYCIVMLGISLFVVSDPVDREAAPQLSDADAPTIDVFVPSYNESAEILALTLSAAKAMVYPADKLRIYLLDDGGTEEKMNSSDRQTAIAARSRSEKLQDLCERLGVIYHARQANRHAKAGNLNSGLEISDAELVVVFDADHAPEKNFLKETVGYFSKDPRLFLVQTPHFFSNPDPIERNLSTFERMPSENEMFYGKVQKGLDRWNASFFCGSAAVLRREALVEAGGFSGITITEDCETALQLHGSGWNSIYVDKPLISGLQPETLASFIGQRSRWCRGMVQLLLLKNPLLLRGLTVPQRLCYLSSSLFWLFPLARAVFFIAPLLFILFNMKIYVASLQEFMAYTVTYLIVAEMVRSYLYGSVRWPLVSELYEYVQSVYLVRAILSVFFSPRSPTFNVTAKDERIEDDRLSELALPYFVLFVLFAIALFVAAYRYQTEPEIAGLLLVVGAWNWFNLIIAGAALGVVTERHDRREHTRLPARATAELVVGEASIPVVLSDISTAGARLAPVGGSELPTIHHGETIYLRVGGDNHRSRANKVPAVLKDREYDEIEGHLSIRFEPQPEHFAAIAKLMLDDLSPVREERLARRRARSIFSSAWTFIVWAVTCPFSALWLAVSGHSGKPAEEPQNAPDLATDELALAPVRAKAGGVE